MNLLKNILASLLIILPLVAFGQVPSETFAIRGEVVKMSIIKNRKWRPHRLVKVEFKWNDELDEFFLISASAGYNYYQLGTNKNCICQSESYEIELKEWHLRDSTIFFQTAVSIDDFVAHFFALEESGVVNLKKVPDGKPSWADLRETLFLIYHQKIYWVVDVSPKKIYSNDYVRSGAVVGKCPCRYPVIID